jgi:phosphinothricin acetyltransferase
VTERDFDAVAEITNHYIRTTAIHFKYDPVNPEELREIWLKGRAVYPYLVLEDTDGVVVGYAKAGRWRERAAYDRTAEVGIYLRHDRHGRGWGTALYRRLIDACRGGDGRPAMRSLIGGIALPNPASIRLHERCGFVHVGTFREVGRKFGMWHDVAFYQRMLEDAG